MAKTCGAKYRAHIYKREGGKCFWCGIDTVLESPAKGRLPDNLATVDHLRPKHDPTRREKVSKGTERRIVLACRKCNHERDKIDYNNLPRETLWRMSGAYPRDAHAHKTEPRSAAQLP
jgi:hypothetical protein